MSGWCRVLIVGQRHPQFGSTRRTPIHELDLSKLAWRRRLRNRAGQRSDRGKTNPEKNVHGQQCHQYPNRRKPGKNQAHARDRNNQCKHAHPSFLNAPVSHRCGRLNRGIVVIYMLRNIGCRLELRHHDKRYPDRSRSREPQLRRGLPSFNNKGRSGAVDTVGHHHGESAHGPFELSQRADNHSCSSGAQRVTQT